MPEDIFNISGTSEDLYQDWREKKLSRRPDNSSQFIIEIDHLSDLNKAQKQSVMDSINRCNFAVYRSSCHDPVSKEDLINLGLEFGLKSLDSNYFADDEGFSAITVSSQQKKGDYIPYTDKAIHWHTDGYYNTDEKCVRSLILHCETPAASGGINRIADNELIYIKLRDENPEFIRALRDTEAFTIPAHVADDGQVLRPDITSSVFSTDKDGRLYMSYTQRTRNIIWKNDPVLKEAVAFLNKILDSSDPDIWSLKLDGGMGIICNNVLHDRSAFEDDPEKPKRLMYRLRYYERVMLSGIYN